MGKRFGLVLIRRFGILLVVGKKLLDETRRTGRTRIQTQQFVRRLIGDERVKLKKRRVELEQRIRRVVLPV